MGTYVSNERFLLEQLLRNADYPKSRHDFGMKITPHEVRRYRTYAHWFFESCVCKADKVVYWCDLGILDACWAANMDLIHAIPDLTLYDDAWPIWIRQPKSPSAKFVFDDEARRGQVVGAMVSGGCIIKKRFHVTKSGIVVGGAGHGGTTRYMIG